jgi:hypothetical protein
LLFHCCSFFFPCLRLCLLFRPFFFLFCVFWVFPLGSARSWPPLFLLFFSVLSLFLRLVVFPVLLPLLWFVPFSSSLSDLLRSRRRQWW